MAQNGTIARVIQLPDCNFCEVLVKRLQHADAVEDITVTKAQYDFRTKDGRWAMGCEQHYRMHRMHPGLGIGKGQKLEVRS